MSANQEVIAKEAAEGENNTAQEKEILATGKTGTVKWFNAKHGFGFINRDDVEGETVFVHHSGLKRGSNTFKASVGDGERVEFDIVKGTKGTEAVNVTGPNGAELKGSPFALTRPQYFRRGGGGFRGHRGGGQGWRNGSDRVSNSDGNNNSGEATETEDGVDQQQQQQGGEVRRGGRGRGRGFFGGYRPRGRGGFRGGRGGARNSEVGAQPESASDDQ